MKTIIFNLCVLGLCAGACTSDKLVAPVSDPSHGEPCDPSLVYFQNDVFPIISSNCAYSGCHGDGSAEDGVDLSTYDLIISTGKVKPGNAGDSKLYKVMIDDDPSDIMPPPPAAPMSDAQKEIILAWINQGAKNDSCEQSNCDLDSITYNTVIQPIVINKCQGCHSGGAPQGGIGLSNYIEVKASVDNGGFFGSINHDQGYVAMPYNTAKMPQCEIDQIADWISRGAPND